MSETMPIRPADLLIDEENPRIPLPNAGQHAALRALAQYDERKLLRLAEDIVASGVDRSNLPIVVPSGDDLNRYIVLEGNRRLGAIKALENPEVLVGSVSASVLSALRKLSRQYQDNPVESLTCLVVKDREAARHWIELRHTGQNEGRGIVPWGSDEVSRFGARTKGLEPHSQLLNFLEESGELTPDERKNVPVTSLKRLVDTPAVRAKLGIEVRDGKVALLGKKKDVARAVRHVVSDLASGKTKVSDIYTKEQRIEYANNLPPNVVVTATKTPGKGAVIGTGNVTTTKTVKNVSGKRAASRVHRTECRRIHRQDETDQHKC